MIAYSRARSSRVFMATSGVVGAVPLLGTVFYTLVSIGLTMLAFTLLYMTVPNRDVDWRDAAWGGLLAALAFEVATELRMQGEQLFSQERETIVFKRQGSRTEQKEGLWLACHEHLSAMPEGLPPP